ncbi:MAG: hypothetical protein JW862_17630 [Anaerolineales bacterium]|nr:hypothetical protein [Anaerolineales bacterium]
MKRKNTLIMIGLVVLLCLSSCGGFASGDPTATPVPPTATFVQPTVILVDGTPQVVVEPINPTPTPDLVNPNPVRITELEYIQTGSQLQIIAKLFNTLTDAILRDVQVEVLALDASGTRIAHEVRTVRYLFPRETTGLVQDFELLPGLETTTVEVRVKEGLKDRQLRYSQPLVVNNTSWVEAEEGIRLTGWINNSDPYTYTNVELNAIAYSASGKIIGGGRGMIDFVPEKDRTGISIDADIHADEEIALVEIYPWITAQSASLEGGTWWENIEVKQWNFIADDYQHVSGGALLKNLTDRLLTETYYLLTVTDAADKVCLAKQGTIDLIWPEQELVFSPGILDLPLDCVAQQVDMIIVPGEFGQFQLGYDPLEAGMPVVNEGGETVSVNIINNLNADISSAVVYVVIYDAEGKIVGGGSAQSGNIRANSSLTVQVPVIYLGILEELKFEASVIIPKDVTIGP